MTPENNQSVRGYLEEFERRTRGATGPLTEVRRSAIAELESCGFPTVRDEDWKFTNLTSAVSGGFSLATGTVGGVGIESWVDRIAGQEDGTLLVFAAGRWAGEYSREPVLPGEAYAGSLAALLERDPDRALGHFGCALDARAHGFVALNTALFEDGAAIVVPEGVRIEAPVHLLFVGPPAGRPCTYLPRNLIVLEEGAAATVIEHYVGEEQAGYFTDAATEIHLGCGAQLEHIKIQDEATAGYHVNRIEVRQERESRLTARTLSLGAKLSRSETHVHLAGSGAECELTGLALGTGGRHVDHFTAIDHAASCTRSTQVYKGVCSGHSRAVFTGKVLVREGTEKVSAEQTNKNLLLSAHALVETRPQLEIYADDVQCSHGATVGQLDQDMLFYIRQRGIDEGDARALLTYAFASDIVDDLPAGRLREAVAAQVRRCIDADGDSGSQENAGDKRGSGVAGSHAGNRPAGGSQ